MFFEGASMLYAGFLNETTCIKVPEEYKHIAEQVVQKIKWGGHACRRCTTARHRGRHEREQPRNDRIVWRA